MSVKVGDWVEIPSHGEWHAQRIGRVSEVERTKDGLYRFSVWWEPIPVPGGQRIQGVYGQHELNTGWIRPLNLLDRLVRET